MVSSEKNENLVKLRALTKKICESDTNDINENNYKFAFEEIQNVIQNEGIKINHTHNDDKKIKCYESLYSKIKSILNKIKIN